MKRRDLIKGTAGVISAGTAFTLLSGKWAFAAEAMAQGAFEGPVDVLNYALTLEYLEATFYQRGNEASLLDGREASLLKEVQSNEEEHVTALQKTIKSLGGKPVDAPKVDFGDAFSSAESYLQLAFVFENTGVGAYLGAAPALYKEKELLKAAASIYGVEARHAAVIGELLGKPAEGGVYMGAFETPLTREEVLKKVKPFIVTSGGGGDDDGQVDKVPEGGVQTGRGSASDGIAHAALLGTAAAAAAGAGAVTYYGSRTHEGDQA